MKVEILKYEEVAYKAYPVDISGAEATVRIRQRTYKIRGTWEEGIFGVDESIPELSDEEKKDVESCVQGGCYQYWV